MSKDEKRNISIQLRRWKWAKCFNNWTKIVAYKQMYSCEMFCTNLAFQKGDLVIITCSTVKSSLKDHFLKVLKLTVLIFFSFALEAILKIDLESFNRGNWRENYVRGRPVWATTTAQCTLGTIQNGGWEKINNVSVSYMLTSETTTELLY